MKFVFSISDVKRYRYPTHINDLVMDRSEATTSEVFVTVLHPGEAPPLHQHDDTEQVFYILDGEGILRIGKEENTYPVQSGNVVRVPPKTPHSIQCLGEKSLRYLVVDCFVEGRPKEEPTWDSHVRVLCKRQGWDYDKIRSAT